ncbi:hypothetical protein SKAU_G00144210 [Synaphobranchus kaupii]|uniref:Uncharacterized protein n=1 Tax=Synaphobranchus kaupii TaxID=118154 RepID=A0A9Q1FSU5_SYNKA|nr:hypothetical protein SKAU_G00144210 [Synaphobranchus kaupii]
MTEGRCRVEGPRTCRLCTIKGLGTEGAGDGDNCPQPQTEPLRMGSHASQIRWRTVLYETKALIRGALDTLLNQAL